MAYFIRPVRRPMRDNLDEGYHGVSRLHDDIDRLFGGCFPNGWGRRQWPAENVAPQVDLVPQLDVTSDDVAYCVHIELPGVSPEAVSIKVADNVLTISGEKKSDVAENARTWVQERSYGSFSRSLALPEDADCEAIRAFAKDGVFVVEIPRKRPETARTRTIEVQRG